MLGHPKGLYILFFTEMWERFSYYGMRAILILFLTSETNGGLSWTEPEALSLYGIYTMVVYVMSIPGGYIADKFLGQKRSVMLGGGLLVAGHLLMAITTMWAFYTALVLIVLGVGFLKPNISTMVGGLYKDGDRRRDSGFIIFYMGINLGAFLSSILVGYIGENIGWHYGFALAGFGMILGQAVFVWGQKYLKDVGNLVVKETKKSDDGEEYIKPLTHKEKDRLKVIAISFTIILIFWAAFEQAGGMMSLFTKQKTDRFATTEIKVDEFKSVGATATDSVAMEVVKDMVQDKRAFEIHSFSDFIKNLFSPEPKTFEELNAMIDTTKIELYRVNKYSISENTNFGNLNLANLGSGSPTSSSLAFKKKDTSYAGLLKEFPDIDYREGRDNKWIYYEVDSTTITLGDYVTSRSYDINKSDADSLLYNNLTAEKRALDKIDGYYVVSDLNNTQTGFIVPTSWFQSLNALFILIFGGIVAGFWIFLRKRKSEPSTMTKFGMSTIILGIGFALMIFATFESDTNLFGKSSMWWLVGAYLFHTLGELCISPIALSFITKLSPKHMVATMMGLYFAVTGFGNYFASLIGEQASEFGPKAVFIGITLFTILFGVILLFFAKRLMQMTHGADEVKED